MALRQPKNVVTNLVSPFRKLNAVSLLIFRRRQFIFRRWLTQDIVSCKATAFFRSNEYLRTIWCGKNMHVYIMEYMLFWERKSYLVYQILALIVTFRNLRETEKNWKFKNICTGKFYIIWNLKLFNWNIIIIIPLSLTLIIFLKFKPKQIE